MVVLDPTNALVDDLWSADWHLFHCRMCHTFILCWIPTKRCVPQVVMPIHPPSTHTVNTVNNQEAIGNWAQVGPNETVSDYVRLGDELALLAAEYSTGIKIPTDKPRVNNFLALIVKYIPGNNLRDGFINTVDLAVFVEGYGKYSSSMAQGSGHDVLLLPQLPNVTVPALRLDIDNTAPTYFERLNALPGSLVTKTIVSVVNSPAFYVRTCWNTHVHAFPPSHPTQSPPQPFDVYNATISFSLAYANGSKGNALHSANSPSPAWGLLFWPSAELLDISATVEVCCTCSCCAALMSTPAGV